MRFFVTILACIMVMKANGQTVNEWTWVCGNSSAPHMGVYGVIGIPDSANTPPPLYEFCQWEDLNGNFWIYGGLTMVGGAPGNPCNLWKFDPTMEQWTWMKGAGEVDTGYCQPDYGTLQIPSDNGRPGIRNFAPPTWTDLQGNLWLFGGLGFDTLGYDGAKNDLWKYDIVLNQWVWMHGNQSVNGGSVYNGIGLFADSNVPAARFECDGTWVDSVGNLWLYGGGNPSLQALSDLWMYDIALGQWACISDGAINTPAIYGTQGITLPGNHPGARWVYCTWKDNITDEFYFFGGGGAGGNPPYNDIWKYNRFSGEWTWTDGTNVAYDPGMFNETCSADEDNWPEATMENRARCMDLSGRLWMFSTGPSNDLWVYDVNHQKWIWVWAGTDPLNDIIVTQGTPHPENEPCMRSGAALWCDSLGNLWLTGGGYTNAMWKFTPDYDCINYELNSENMFIPNVFTPNGDGINDEFLFNIDPKLVEHFHCFIINRWGVTVAELDSIADTWNGTDFSGDDCTDGVYFYVYNGTLVSGDSLSGNGIVNLIAGQ
jgi:gliding motility-associated-like protein